MNLTCLLTIGMLGKILYWRDASHNTLDNCRDASLNTLDNCIGGMHLALH